MNGPGLTDFRTADRRKEKKAERPAKKGCVTMDLQDLRGKINGIDREIVDLYVQRMETAKAIGIWKEQNGKPVYDPERERELLDRVAEQAGSENREGVRELFSLLMAHSRARQEENGKQP